MVGASALQSIDLGFIPLVESYLKTLKRVSIASLLDARHLWEVVENKSASLLVVSLGKALNGMPKDFKNGIYSFPPWCSAFMGGCGEQAGKFACCVLGQGT